MAAGLVEGFEEDRHPGRLRAALDRLTVGPTQLQAVATAAGRIAARGEQHLLARSGVEVQRDILPGRKAQAQRWAVGDDRRVGQILDGLQRYGQRPRLGVHWVEEDPVAAVLGESLDDDRVHEAATAES